MFIVIIFLPVDDFINFEINFKSFFQGTKKVMTKKAFKVS